MKKLLASLCTIMLLGCGPEEDTAENMGDDGYDYGSGICSCEIPNGAKTKCNTGDTSTYEWQRKPNKSCKESQIDLLSACCPGTRTGSSLLKDFKQYAGQHLLYSNLYATTGKAKITTNPFTNNVELSNDLSCQNECSRTSSSKCEIITDEETLNKLLELNTKVKSLSSIPKEDVLSIFGVDDDPCERNQVSIEGDYIFNEGKKCVFEVKTKLAGDEVVRVDIPPTLKGTFKSSAAGTKVKFNNSSNTLFISIGNEFLNKDHGGYIYEMGTLGSGVYVKSENSCLLIKG